MQGVFIGHLSFYNKNQIRDKLLLVLIFKVRREAISMKRGWMDLNVGGKIDSTEMMFAEEMLCTSRGRT